MTSTESSHAIFSTFASVQRLRGVINDIPPLTQTQLGCQLRATAGLCTILQQFPGLLASDSAKEIVCVLKSIGEHEDRIKEHIEAISSANPVDWSTCHMEGRTISEVSGRIQMLTSAVFIGAVAQAL